MQLEIFTICDAATDHANKLNILGATDTLIVPSLPFKYPHCCIVMRFRMARVEEGEHQIKLLVTNPSGKTIMNMDGKMNIKIGNGSTSAVNVIINVNNLQLAEAGEHKVALAVDGIQMSAMPLFIRARKEDGPHVMQLPG